MRFVYSLFAVAFAAGLLRGQSSVPTLSQPIPALSFQAGGPAATIALANYFTVPGVVGTLEGVGLLHHALRGLDGHPLRHQVVARVAVGNLDDVARLTELVDGLLEKDLHRLEYGRRAICRAFFTAVATSR